MAATLAPVPALCPRPEEVGPAELVEGHGELGQVPHPAAGAVPGGARVVPAVVGQARLDSAACRVKRSVVSVQRACSTVKAVVFQ